MINNDPKNAAQMIPAQILISILGTIFPPFFRKILYHFRSRPRIFFFLRLLAKCLFQIPDITRLRKQHIEPSKLLAVPVQHHQVYGPRIRHIDYDADQRTADETGHPEQGDISRTRVVHDNFPQLWPPHFPAIV